MQQHHLPGTCRGCERCLVLASQTFLLYLLQVKHKYGLPRFTLLRAMLRRELILFQVPQP